MEILGDDCHVTFEIDLGYEYNLPIDLDLESGQLYPPTLFEIQDAQTSVVFACRTLPYEALSGGDYWHSPSPYPGLDGKDGHIVSWRLRECNEPYAWHGLIAEVHMVDVIEESDDLHQRFVTNIQLVESPAIWPWQDLFRGQVLETSG